MKITFKKHPKNTGLMAVGYPYTGSDVKLDKQVIGYIAAPNWQTDDFWEIRFAVIKEDITEDGNPNCVWKWVTLAKKFEDENSAKQFIRDNIVSLSKQFKFHVID